MDHHFDITHVIYRDQGYGSNPGILLSRYTLTVEDEELLQMFSRPFEEFVAQCRQDDSTSVDSDVPQLKTLDYPSLPQMLVAHRATLANLLKDYLYFQLLEALLAGNQRPTWRFAVNEIATVSDEGRGFVLSGDGYFIQSRSIEGD